MSKFLKCSRIKEDVYIFYFYPFMVIILKKKALTLWFSAVFCFIIIRFTINVGIFHLFGIGEMTFRSVRMYFDGLHSAIVRLKIIFGYLAMV